MQDYHGIISQEELPPEMAKIAAVCRMSYLPSFLGILFLGILYVAGDRRVPSPYSFYTLPAGGTRHTRS